MRAHLSFDLSTRELTIHSFHSDGTALGKLPIRITEFSRNGLRLPKVAFRPGMGAVQKTRGRIWSTDEEGKLVIKGLSTQNSYRIECADARSYPTMEPVVLEPSENPAEIEVFDARGASLSVLVTGLDGLPTKGFFLWLERQGQVSSAANLNLTSNAQGLVQFWGLEAGEWLLRGPELESPLPLSLRTGESRRLNLPSK